MGLCPVVEPLLYRLQFFLHRCLQLAQGNCTLLAAGAGGQDALALLNVSRLDEALKTGPVVIDGLYSWEEYISLKEYYGTGFLVVAIWASPEVRYARLAVRELRPLNEIEAFSRDQAEIVKLNKGGPIAMADYTILNEDSFKDLRKEVGRIVKKVIS